MDCNGIVLKLQVSCRNMHPVGEELRFNIDMNMIWPVEDEPDPEPVVTEPRKGAISGLFSSIRLHSGTDGE